MRQKIFLTETKAFQKAILRAYGDEPLVRYVVMNNNRTIMVCTEENIKRLGQEQVLDNWIGWPKEDVYSYDPKTFQSILHFYIEGEKEELKKAWSFLPKLFI